MYIIFGQCLCKLPFLVIFRVHGKTNEPQPTWRIRNLGGALCMKGEGRGCMAARAETGLMTTN